MLKLKIIIYPSLPACCVHLKSYLLYLVLSHCNRDSGGDQASPGGCESGMVIVCFVPHSCTE